MIKPLQEQLAQAAEVLKSYGAREVYVFGSAATGTMDEYSDIDIAVSGIPDELFFRAMGQAGDCLNRQIDLIDLDEENPFTRYLKEENELVPIG